MSNMRRIILLLICACLLSPPVCPQTGAPSRKRRPAPAKKKHQQESGAVPKDELDKLIEDLPEAEWMLVTTGGGRTLHYSPRRRTYPAKSTVRTWIKHTFDPPEKDVSVILALIEYDCADRKERVWAHAIYDKLDKVIFSSNDDKPSAWVFVTPESLGEAALETLCGGMR